MSDELETWLTQLKALRCDPRRTASGQWTARCPAHDDKKPSLSLRSSDDGRILSHCFAGCTFDAVRSALGIASPTPTDKTPRDRAVSAGSRASGRRPAPYATLDEAARRSLGHLGTPSARWIYQDVHGQEVGAVMRWDTPAGKEIRPFAKTAEGWCVKAMKTPRALYRLPDLASADLVVVCEGEKAAEAARLCGFTATTASGGASAAAKSDWSPLHGKHVILLPDNDAPGEKAAADWEQLSRAAGAASVSVVRLAAVWDPIPDGGDIADVFDAWGDDTDDLRQKIEALASANIDGQIAEQPADPLAFPLESFPEPLRAYIEEGARVVGCSEALIGVPLLAAIASAIGLTHSIRLKNTWSEPPVFWGITIGESGTGKSPAMKLALRFVRERHEASFRRYSEAKRAFEARLRRESGTGGAGEGPHDDEVEAPPTFERVVVSDLTIESLVSILDASPRGVLVATDEVSTWLGSMGRYSKAKEAERSTWLTMHDCTSIQVDRKGDDPKYLGRPFICLAGTTQPQTFERLFSGENAENGLLARLLFVRVDRLPARWSTSELDEALISSVGETFARLYRLTGLEDGAPRELRLSPEAEAVWEEFYNQAQEETLRVVGPAASCRAKRTGQCARLALILELAQRAASSECAPSGEVGTEALQRAISLVRWFGAHADALFQELGATGDERRSIELARWVGAKGVPVSTRMLYRRGDPSYDTVAKATNALEAAVKRGLLVRVHSTPSRKGGRPTVRYLLAKPQA